MKKTLPHLTTMVLLTSLLACVPEQAECVEPVQVGQPHAVLYYVNEAGEQEGYMADDNGYIYVPCAVDPPTSEDGDLQGMFIII